MRVSQIAARRIRQIRKSQGVSQTDLAERLRAIGVPKSKSTLARMESEKKSESRVPTLDEVFEFAAALDVSPRALVLPVDDLEVDVTIAPRVVDPAWRVARWLDGEALPSRNVEGTPDDAARAMQTLGYHLEPERFRASAARDHPAMRAVRALSAVTRDAIVAERAGVSWNRRELAESLRRAIDEVAPVVRALAAEGSDQA